MADTWLYLDNPRMKGPAVRRWQELLIALGEDLGQYGPDGIFGPATDTATRKQQALLGVTADGIVGPKTIEAAQTKLEGDGNITVVPGTGAIASIIDGVEVYDYRKTAKPPKNYSYDRTWDKITGVMLHRTACVLGENPERYLPVNAHIGVTMGGKIVLAHAWEKMIWHGHSPSPWTIGIEFDGNPEGKHNYHWRPGGGPHTITDAQLKAADVLFQLLLKGFTANGQDIKYVLAHRQSSSDRECDPGWECWQQIAVPWMERAGAIPGPRPGHPATAGLALPVGYAGDTWGTGLQIPTEWDSRSTIPFWR